MKSLPDLTLPTAADVESAAQNLADVVEHTPLLPNARLSAASGAQVYLKREDLQPVRSYKLRGAYNLISSLAPAQREAGVICASAGNHGQGVAFACSALGIRGRIFVPTTTPRQKRDRMIALGGEWVELVVTGATYDDAAAAALAESERSGATLVPAFDHASVIAGQGSVAPEIVEQLGSAPDVLIVPVGGGGILSGCLTWFAEHAPQTRIVGVEPASAACMAAALAAGTPITLDNIDTFVDGAAVKRAGVLTSTIVANHDVELITVPEGQVCSEMLDLYQVDGVLAEPAGALAPAVLRRIKVEPGQRVVAIISGGNNDVSRYSEIVERSLVFEGHKHYFLVQFAQEPGALRRFLNDVLGPEDDITLFEYTKRSNRELGPALVGIELGDPADLPALLGRIQLSGIQVERIPPDSPLYRFLV